MDISAKLSSERLKTITDDLHKWTALCEAFRGQLQETTGETRIGYAAVYNDYLWKLKLSTQKLWYYLAGCEELNPFEPLPSSPLSSFEQAFPQ